ncbi:MAG: site-specific DNA-methyltransferase [Alphaproteobacteria bacterium]|nr:site-specific DNA-methyltransferase [Alphaproteobacteria bacterium]
MSEQTLEKMDLTTPAFVDENIAKLAELFPACVTESKNDKGEIVRAIDFDLLRQEFSDNIVEGPQERYSLNWPGKRKALVTANTPISKTLRPCRDESVDFDTTKNIFIEGDNLDALKLLQETYLNKIKMIYIDPPYNTGNDFIYNDTFTADKDEYDEASGQRDEDGSRLVSNPDSNGRYHSDWLSMMYPRLKLARNLLRENGVIFISIDDNEQASLKRLCDEIFGELNFLTNIIWQKKYAPQNDAKYFSASHEHIICFAKNIETFSIGLLPRTNEANKRYKNPDNDPRGSWKSSDLTRQEYRPRDDYSITSPKTGKKFSPPDGCSWGRPKEKIEEMIKENRIWFGSDGNNVPSIKRFLKEVKQGITPQTIWERKDVGDTQEGKKIIKEYLGNVSIFETAKPPRLIQRQLLVSDVKDGDIILDFFAGSGSTAEAIMTANTKANYILVQLPEKCDEKSEAFKAGYKNIAEISKERIRRAGKKIKEDFLKKEGADKEGIENLDIGFRVFKIDSSNMVDVTLAPDETKPDMFDSLVGNIKKDRSAEDLLFQVLLDWGVDLSLPIIREDIDGHAVFFVDGNALAACFDEGINEDFVKKLADKQPLRAVFRDDGFASDAVKINVEQIFKLKSPATDIKVI